MQKQSGERAFTGKKDRQREEDGVSIIGKASIVSCRVSVFSLVFSWLA
jgi:hypothetical protein